MRPAEFSPEEIIAAGEALVAAGRNVTGFALRQKVGGGNPNRLKQVWDESQAEVELLERQLSEARTHGQAQAVELAQLRERLAASEQAVKVAAETHAQELEQAHSDMKAVRAELDTARREAAEKIETLRGELAEHKARAAADAKVHADYRARVEQDTARMTEMLNQTKEALEAARHDAAAARESTAKLSGQWEVMQAQNATLLAAVQLRSDQGAGGK
ncbi:DNA-binding protein [Pokkaliibacter sp. MBI-7]|uniref:DNA-binding protein n=1 Tax=Pokkaliibacter sp. MBI-7 TaxID=3040600 RepID=UPI00244C0CB5|nr:DNA-binding protein [Pokkaliibacter sp. MBI-7]MDH2436627.1 DNA-binding protein [Pokkaliibacter sp. MBI-7]